MSLLERLLPARRELRELRLQLRVHELEAVVAESLEARARRHGLVYAPMSAEVAGVMMRQPFSPPVTLTVQPDASHPLLVELVCRVLQPVPIGADQVGARLFVFMADGACIGSSDLVLREDELGEALVNVAEGVRQAVVIHRRRGAAGSN